MKSRIRRLALISMSMIFMLGALVSTADARVKILKAEPIASSGACTPPATAADASVVMKRFNIDILNGKTAHDIALTRGLKQIERLAGGRFQPAEGVDYHILSKKGCARQMGTYIILRQGCGSLTSVAYYVHELGHYVGNNNGGKLYREYRSTVRKRCAVTNYALKDWTKARARNEEFAEVFAAFVTHPNLLLKAGPACVQAYNFFRDHVFEKGELASCQIKKSEDDQQIATALMSTNAEMDASEEQGGDEIEGCGEAGI